MEGVLFPEGKRFGLVGVWLLLYVIECAVLPVSHCI